MRYQLLTVCSVLIVAACAGTPGHEADPTMAAGEQLICTREYPTGSHLPKRVCRTKAQMEEDERNARMLEDRARDRVPGRTRQPGGT